MRDSDRVADPINDHCPTLGALIESHGRRFYKSELSELLETVDSPPCETDVLTAIQEVELRFYAIEIASQYFKFKTPD